MKFDRLSPSRTSTRTAPLPASLIFCAQLLKNTVLGVPAGLCDAKMRRVCAGANAGHASAIVAMTSLVKLRAIAVLPENGWIISGHCEMCCVATRATARHKVRSRARGEGRLDRPSLLRSGAAEGLDACGRDTRFLGNLAVLLLDDGARRLVAVEAA